MRTETFIALLSGCFWLTLVLTIALIGIVATKRYRTQRERKRTVIVKAISALGIWLVLSFGVLIMQSLYSWAVIHMVEDNLPIKLELATVSMVGTIALHILAGSGLVYWTGCTLS